MARLKVFSWSDGFHRYSVAVPSRAKALAAWGVQQDLFKSGLARELTSGRDYDEALASPDVVVERQETIDPRLLKAKRPARKRPSKPDTARIASLEADLARVEKAHNRETAAIETRLRKVERARDEEQAAYRKRRAELDAALKAERAR